MRKNNPTNEDLLVLDEELRQLQTKKKQLLNELATLDKNRRECDECYERTVQIKRQFDSMIEDSVDFFRNNLYERNSEVKILRRGYEKARDVLYGSQMQQATDEIQAVLRSLVESSENFEQRDNAICQQIAAIDREIAHLKAERGALYV